MEIWIIFVLIAELMWAFTSFFDKILLSKRYIRNPLVFIIFNGFMNVLLVFLLPFFSLGPLKILDIIIVLLAGIFLSAGVALYYRAVQSEEISRVLMLWQLMPVFVLLISFLFLQESLTRNHFIGFLFLFAAGAVVSYKKSHGLFKLSTAFYFMIGSTFLISLAYILSKYIYQATSFWNAFIWLRIGAFSGLIVLLSPSIRKQSAETIKLMPRRARALICFKMLVDFSAFIALGFAILNGPISLISALGSATAPVFIFIITIFTSLYLPHIVKESIDKKSVIAKLAAIALIIIGIIFVNL